MLREKVLAKIGTGALTMQQGADIAGVSVRQLRRWRRRYERQGAAGLIDQRAQAVRSKRVSLATAATICRLKAEKYDDFSVRHFYEKLTEQHNVAVSYGYVLKLVQRQGLVDKIERRGTYRRRRPRQPMVGLRLHMDSSTHPWLGALLPSWDLTIVVDDADGRILSARFSPEEGVLSTLWALWDVLTTKGRFAELYTDRGSHFCHTKDGQKGPVGQQPTQVSRVLRTLGIRHIWARTPQARGRGERIFGTIQGRLPQELRAASITTYEAANRYLQEVFVPDYNRRFTVQPKEPGSAYTALLPGVDLRLLLSVHDERTVRNDFTVSHLNRCLQLSSAAPTNLPGRKITVHTFLDASLGISHRGRLLACFDRHGNALLSPQDPSPAHRPQTQPKPTPAGPTRRRSTNDFDGFWNFLQHDDPADPVVSRNDLFCPDWYIGGGHL